MNPAKGAKECYVVVFRRIIAEQDFEGGKISLMRIVDQRHHFAQQLHNLWFGKDLWGIALHQFIKFAPTHRWLCCHQAIYYPAISEAYSGCFEICIDASHAITTEGPAQDCPAKHADYPAVTCPSRHKIP